jgi:hypothetical protein
MKADRVTVEDIKGIGAGGQLKIELPDYGAAVSARNMVQYVRDRYKRDDGLTYGTHTDKKTNTITIFTTDKRGRK